MVLEPTLNGETAYRRNRRKSFTAEPHRTDSVEIVGTVNFARRVPCHRKSEFVGSNATPIVREVIRLYWEKKRREKAKEFAQTDRPGLPAGSGTL